MNTTMHTAPFLLEDLADVPELEPADHDLAMARIRWHLHTPWAFALKRVVGEAFTAGLGLAIAHHHSGWVGERLHHPEFNSAQERAHLIRELVHALEQRHCTTQYALVNEEEVNFFASLGFVAESHYVRYAGGQCEAPELDNVQLAAPVHTLGLYHLDRNASGEDRRTLLQEHAYGARVFVQNNSVRGFYLMLLGEGLIIADGRLAGFELLRWLLPHVNSVMLPEDNTGAAEFLEQRNYGVVERRVRMRRGDALAWRAEWVYAHIGAHLG